MEPRNLPTSFGRIRLFLTVLVSFVAFGLGTILVKQVLAQGADSFAVAHPYQVEGEDLTNGTVISYKGNTYVKSSEPFDKTMFGVIADNPAIEFLAESSTDSATPLPDNVFPVVTSGVAEVRVSAKNGRIKRGDLITTSDQPGVAMRADKSGFILGIAQEAYGPESLEELGLIKVALDPKFAFNQDSPTSESIGDRLLEIVNFSTLAALQEPSTFFRYLMAAAMLLGAIAVSFISLARTAQKGIDAMGRNPLAKGSITLSIFFNVLISLVMMISGVAGAYFLIVLK